MTEIRELENTICQLELAELADTKVSSHAVVQVIDPNTLVVVMFSGRNTEVVERAIRTQQYSAKQIATQRDVITITI